MGRLKAINPLETAYEPTVIAPGVMRTALVLMMYLCSILSTSVSAAKLEDLSVDNVNRIHFNIHLGKSIALDLVSQPPFRFSEFKGKTGLTQFTPLYSGWLESLFFGKSCRIYLGEFPKQIGIYSKSPPLESQFVELKVVGKDVLSVEAAKEVFATLPGSSQDFDIQILKNKNGLQVAYANFVWIGGRSYSYALILDQPSVLISEAQWVDLESISTKPDE